MPSYAGGCLCGELRYMAEAVPEFPHLCSCRMCQKWSGAPTVAWVAFPLDAVAWTGAMREPAYFRSSASTRRGFCPTCGGTVCALNDGSDQIYLTIATLDDPSQIVPGAQHSYRQSAPRWWETMIVGHGEAEGV
jgi:hypothetical protein